MLHYLALGLHDQQIEHYTNNTFLHLKLCELDTLLSRPFNIPDPTIPIRYLSDPTLVQDKRPFDKRPIK